MIPPNCQKPLATSCICKALPILGFAHLRCAFSFHANVGNICSFNSYNKGKKSLIQEPPNILPDCTFLGPDSPTLQHNLQQTLITLT